MMAAIVPPGATEPIVINTRIDAETLSKMLQILVSMSNHDLLEGHLEMLRAATIAQVATQPLSRRLDRLVDGTLVGLEFYGMEIRRRGLEVRN